MPAGPPRSALVFKVNKLGDNIAFLPVAQRLVAEGIFEQVTIWNTPLAAPLYRPLEPRVRLELITREAFYPAWKKPAALWNLVQKARRPRPQSVLVAEDMGNTAYFLALASGATHRLGVQLPYIRIPRALTENIPIRHSDPAPVKSWQLGRALARTAGAAEWPAAPPPPDLAHLLRYRVLRRDVLIHAGASLDYQRWPLERYAELASRLARDLRVGWFHLPAFPAPALDPKVEVIHSLELQDLVSPISATGVFVCNNSGPLNVASALGTPCVVLIGPSSRAWDPYWHADRCRILRDESLPCISCDIPGRPIQQTCKNLVHPMACMDGWTVETVENEVRAWLHTQKSPGGSA